MSPERQSKEIEPRKKTLDLIHLLERLPIRNGMSVADVVEETKIAELPNIILQEDPVDVFLTQRQQQKTSRDKSEFKSAYMRKYHELMQSAQVTSACQELAFWAIDQGYDTGVNRKSRMDGEKFANFELYRPIPSPFIYIVQDYVDHPTSDGIFDAQTAETIEMKMYNRSLNHIELLKYYIDMTRYVAARHSEVEPLSEEDAMENANDAFLHFLPLIKENWNIPVHGESAEEVIGTYEQLHIVWRMQIEQQYGITPHTEFSEDPKYFAST